MSTLRREESAGSCKSLENTLPLSKNTGDISPSSVVPSRFYVIDWLEQLDELAMQQAKAVIQSNGLKTPVKPAQINEKPSILSGFRLETLFIKNPPVSTKSRTESKSDLAANLSPHRRRSEALGNGWNAKGLQKAKMGEWEDAILCWGNALEIRLQVLGENHPDVANTFNNMGIALGRLERYDEAMELLNRTLKIRTLLYGNVHLEIAATLHNIGNVFQQLKDYNGALRCFEEAQRTQHTLLGNGDILVARTAIAIGHLNFEYSRFGQAFQCYLEARDIFQRAGVSEGNEEYDNVLLDIEDAKIAIFGEND